MEEIVAEMKRIAHYLVSCSDRKLLEYYKGVLNGLQMALEILREKEKTK